MTIERYRMMLSPRSGEEALRLFSSDLRPLVAATAGTDEDWRPPGFGEWDPFAQLQHYELTVRLPDMVLWHVDRSSMAHGLEARVPFLDHELVELCARVPPRLKLRVLREKYILRRAMAPLLPPEITWRRKRGLRAPAGAWLRAPLPEFALHQLDERTVREKGYFDPAAVRLLVERHRTRAVAGGAELIGILAVHLWDDLLRSARRISLPPHTSAARCR
jgi:asparagine synthase (glutamine-hydrolysing)